MKNTIPFDQHWVIYVQKFPILAQPRIRIKTKSLENVAREFHLKGTRQESFEVFWAEIRLKNPSFSAVTVEVSSNGVKQLARYAYLEVQTQDKSGTEKIKEGMIDLFGELAELASKKTEKFAEKFKQRRH